MTSAVPPTGGAIQGGESDLWGNAQYPAPLIYATTNDVVEIQLKNLGVKNGAAPNDPHTIHLHGMDVDVANDGVPETSVATIPANLAAVPGAGNVVVYMFAPKKAGTYFYHCHQEADIHVQMGMYGALVIYNPSDAAASTGPNSGKGGMLFGWKYDKDVVLLLSEIDTRQHVSEELSQDPGFNPVDLSTAVLADQRPVLPQYDPRKQCRHRLECMVQDPSRLRSPDRRKPEHSPSRDIHHQRDQGPAADDQHGLRNPTHAHARLPRQDYRLRPAGLVLGEPGRYHAMGPGPGEEHGDDRLGRRI